MRYCLEHPDRRERDTIPEVFERHAKWAMEFALESCGPAMEWLVAQPAWKMAMDAAGFTEQKSDDIHWLRCKYETLARQAAAAFDEKPDISLWYTTRRFAEAGGRFLAYASGVGDALAAYSSGSRAKGAVDGPELVSKMKNLLREFDRCVDQDWITPANRKQLRRIVHASKAIEFLNENDLAGNPSSRRNDDSLRSRLFAQDVIRVHLDLFRDPTKRAVFHLTSLPIIDRPLEMRTIERIIAVERARRRKERESSNIAAIRPVF